MFGRFFFLNILPNVLKTALLSDYVKTNIYRNVAVVVSYFRTYSKQTHTERTSEKQYSSVQIKLAMAMRFSSITVAIICSVDLFQSDRNYGLVYENVDEAKWCSQICT